MTFTFLAPKDSGEDRPDFIEDLVESFPKIYDPYELPRFLPESRSSIRLIRLFLSCFKFGLYLLVLDRYSLGY